MSLEPLPRVVMLGAFPPPVGGAAKINEIVYDSLRGAGVDVVKVDLAAGALAHNRGLGYHLRRIGRNLSGLSRGWFGAAPYATLYAVPDGGAGAWYTLVHLRALARRYARYVIHHHTCRYIEQYSRPIGWLSRIRPERAVHVFLTCGMARAFVERYGPVHYRVASNSRFVTEEANRQGGIRVPGPLRIGHLSNLCRDKGFFEVVDTFERLRAEGMAAELWLAGPVLEPEVQSMLDAIRQMWGSAIKYKGAITGEAKLLFYRELDLFLFPTRWRQEAAPIVAYEALAAGVPVVTTDRGVIPEIVHGKRGVVCSRDANFVEFAINYIKGRDWTGPVARACRVEIKTSLRAECETSIAEYAELLILLGADPATAGRVRNS